MYFVWALAMCLVAAGCSKDNDDATNSIEKTYADDDFVMTERNIKEKMIGKWEITQLRTYDGAWIHQEAKDLGTMKNVTVRADGTGELFGMEGVHWRVGKDTLVVSSLCLVGYSADGKISIPIPLGSGNNYGIARSEAESTLKNLDFVYAVKTELREMVRMRVLKMEKDYFRFEQLDKSMAAMCDLRRLK